MLRPAGWCRPGFIALLILSWVASCASPRKPVVVQPGRPFIFQNSFWVNLHHVLRADARKQARGAELNLALEDLPADERAAWSAGLRAYEDLAQKSLLFDEELVAINVALAGAGNPGNTLPAGLVSRELTAALNGAAPIYRARSWPEQSRANQQWIAQTEPLVARHARALTSALAAAYRVAWPALPILVDPCSESGPFLAYTTSAAPPGFAGLITISPNETNRGPVAFECVAHEASHVVDEALTRMVAEESARQGLEPPPELWHAMLFFTSGVLSERILGAAGTYKSDVEQGYPAYAAALESHWLPYLEARTTLEPALIDLVRDADLERAARPEGR